MEYRTSQERVDYEEAVEAMERRVAAIHAGEADELLWFLEHPPLYTAGTNADQADLIDQTRFPVYHTGRGGQYTYHGPGQRVAYVMLDLKKRADARGDAPDLRAYVHQLEQWLIDTLAQFDITGERREGRVGVWVVQNSESESQNPDRGQNVRASLEPSSLASAKQELRSGVAGSRRSADRSGKLNANTTEKKIAALGMRVRKWVTYHGISLNVNPDLSHYGGIIPCGIAEFGVTSLAELGINVTMQEVDAILKQEFERIFHV